jgi:hypothetical protein
VGEVTRTDVAQPQAQLAAGKTQELQAESQATATRSNYRRILGSEPQTLAPGSPVDRSPIALCFYFSSEHVFKPHADYGCRRRSVSTPHVKEAAKLS